jgi:hypothetical protein
MAHPVVYLALAPVGESYAPPTAEYLPLPEALDRLAVEGGVVADNRTLTRWLTRGSREDRLYGSAEGGWVHKYI